MSNIALPSLIEILNKYNNDFETDIQKKRNMNFIEILRTYIILNPILTIKKVINHILIMNKNEIFQIKEEIIQGINIYINFIFVAMKNIDINLTKERTYCQTFKNLYNKYLDNFPILFSSVIKNIIHEEIMNSNLIQYINAVTNNHDIEELNILKCQAECQAIIYV